MNIKLKLFFILLFAIIYGCENIPSGIVEPKNVDYKVEEISAPDVFIYSEDNKVLTTSIKISKSEVIDKVWFDVLTADGFEIVSSGNLMTEVEFGVTRTYYGTLSLSETLLSGDYDIIYYVQDRIRTIDANVMKVGVKKFRFESTAVNFPPQITNLIMPNEVNRGEDFIFSINASDPNGKNDIQAVFFTLLRPDSTIVFADTLGNTQFPMFDNGDSNIGDQTAGDGVYSLKNSFSNSSQTGIWKFTFNAIDKSDSISNTITHSLNVK